MVALETSEKIGFDLDDTLLGRETVTRLAVHFRGKWRSIKGKAGNLDLPNFTVDTLPDLDYSPQDLPAVKRLGLFFHSRRKAFPGIVEKLERLKDQGQELFGFSGRAGTVEWYNMTRTQLEREDIPLDEIYLTPKGVPTYVSKAVGISRLGIQEFSDDDLKTVVFLAGVFPDRQFNWIKHGLTSPASSNTLLTQFSNIREVPFRAWIST